MNTGAIAGSKIGGYRKVFFEKIDPRLFLFLVAIYTGFEFLALIKTLYFLKKNNFPLSEVPVELFLFDWIAVLAFIYLIVINTRFLLNKNISWRYIFIFHFMMAMFVNAILRFLFESYNYIKNDKFGEFTTELFISRYMAYIDINYLLYIVMMFMVYAYYYTEHRKQTEGQKRVLENHLLQAKLKLLVGQIQPHFLFNTLNSIISLIDTDQEKAKKTILNLSYLLRTTLSLKDEQLVDGRTELKILNMYLEIINTRFGDQVEIEKHIDSAIMDVRIPILILQPIVENSIKHGFNSDDERLKISISIKCNNDKVLIEIENDGRELSSTDLNNSSGTGISNIKSRFTSLYGDDFIFIIQNVPYNKGVRTTLSFPV